MVLLVIVIWGIALIVPSFIAFLTVKKLFKEKSKGVRITWFIVILLVSFALEFLALAGVASMGFVR